MKNHLKSFFTALPYIIALAMISSSRGDVVYVDLKAQGDHSGSSWANACQNLTEGISKLQTGDEIWAASGVYKENLQISTFEVSLYGGFQGTEQSREERNASKNETIIYALDPSSFGVEIANGGITLDGFTVKGSGRYGIFCNGSSAIVANCTITENSYALLSGWGEGGGVGCGGLGSSLTLSNCTISKNQSLGMGGGIICSFSGAIVLENCLIMENESNAGGGGLYCESCASVRLTNCVIAKNKSLDGGGIFCKDCESLSIVNCTVADNKAVSYSGGLWLSNTPAQITNSIFWNSGKEIVRYDETEPIKASCSCIAGGWAGDGNLDSYPLFVDSTNGDYRLQNHSPCIHAGLTSIAPSTDLEGNDRPGKDELVDMGAYESPADFKPDWSKIGPNIYYVRADAMEGGDGLSWENAFSSLHEAIEKADGDTEIWAAAGRYNENLILDPRITLLGGFSGMESQRNERNWNLHETVIDASLANDKPAAILLDKSTLDGFVVTGSVNGGVVCSERAAMTLANCMIRGNTNLYDPNQFVDPSRTYFVGNGGGVFCEKESSPVIVSCTITENIATQGGGIYCFENSKPFVSHCVISKNESRNSGGGIYSYPASSPIIQYTYMLGNKSESTGGAIYSDESSLSISNSIMAGNIAGMLGSAFYSNCAEPNTILQIAYCVMAYNQVLNEDTAMPNRAAIVYNGNNMEISHSIIWGNFPDEILSNVGEGPGMDLIPVSWSDVRGGYEGVGNIDGDPQFVKPWDGAGGDFHFLPASPCIDAGNPDIAANDGCRPPGYGTNRSDMGVYGGPLNCGWIEEYIQPVEEPEIPSLPLAIGETTTGILSTVDRMQLYLIEPSCENVLLTLDSYFLEGQVEMYARLGKAPTRFHYDVYDAQTSGNPRQELILSKSLSGEPWHVMLYGVNLPEGPVNYSMKADCVNLYLSSISPNSAVNRGDKSCTIKGAGFTGELEIKLKNSRGNQIASSDYYIASNQQIEAWFSLANAPLGVYDLEVLRLSDNASVTLANAFNVSEGSIGPRLEAKLSVTDPLRVGMKYILWVEYANTGDSDMRAPILSISSSSGTLMSLSPGGPIDANPVWLLGVGQEGAADVLAAGKSYRIPIYFIATSPTNFQLHLVEGFKDSFWSNTTWTNFEEYYDLLLYSANRLARRGKLEYNLSVLEQFSIDLAAGNPVGAISGWVRSATDEKPIGNVVLGAFDASNKNNAFALSSPGGYFQLKPLPPGEYSFSIIDYYQPTPLLVTLTDGQDINGITLYAAPNPTPAPTPIPTPTTVSDSDPSLIADSSGQAHLAWRHGEDAWHAVFEGNEWKITGAIPNATGADLIVKSDKRLIPDNDKGCAVFWQDGVLNNSELWYCLGRPKADGITYQWSSPQRITDDSYGDGNMDALIAADGSLLLVFQKQDWETQDDTDLYYVVLHPDYNQMQWTSLKAMNRVEWPVRQYPAAGKHGVCVALQWGGEEGYEIPRLFPEIGGRYGFKLIDEYCYETSLCSFANTAQLIGDVQCGDAFSFGGMGQAQQEFTAQTIGSKCVFVPGKATWSIGVSGTRKWVTPESPFKFFVYRLGLFLNATLVVNATWNNGFSFWPLTKPDEGAATLTGSVGGEGIAKMKYLKGSYIIARLLLTSGVKVSKEGLKGVHCFRITFSFGLLKGWWEGTYQYQFGPGCPPPGEDFVGKIARDPHHSTIRNIIMIDGQPVDELITYTIKDATGTENVYGYDPVLEDIRNDLKNDGSPSTAINGSGEILLTWVKDSPNPAANLGGALLLSSFDGGKWSAPVEVDSYKDFNEEPFIVYENDRTPMIVWSKAKAHITLDSPVQEILDNFQQSDLYYSRRIDGAWTQPQLLAELDGTDNDVKLASNKAGKVAACWNNIHSEEATIIMASIWDGSQWTAPQMISDSTACSAPVCAFIDDKAIAIWSQQTENNIAKLYYSVWDGKWSAPQIIPTDNVETAIVTKTNVQSFSVNIQPLDYKPADPTCCLTPTPTPTPKDPKQGEPSNQKDEKNPGVVASKDPNQKVGPLGAGAPDYAVAITEPLEYIVYFENQSTASAAAARVRIADRLDSKLDWSTVEMKSYSFGDRIIAVPAGLDHHYTREMVDLWTYSAADNSWAVSGEAFLDIESSVDARTGMAEWTFTCLDPATEDFLEDPYAGFLPPETAKDQEGYGRGQGYVVYSVRAKSDIPTGTKITNSAEIVFDVNEPILTNAVTNMIVASPPEAPRNPYPSDGSEGIKPETHFNWDETAGAAAYDLYVWPSTQAKPAQPYAGDLIWSHFYPSASLTNYTEYKWQVVSKNAAGQTEGPIWTFHAGPILSPDFNRDGYVDRRDLLMLINAFDRYVEIFDLNHDGGVDRDELFLFAKSWGIRIEKKSISKQALRGYLSPEPTSTPPPMALPTPTPPKRY
ncbi:MAG: choice-of-anchor Q domain-containing protein [Candidatus Omnitrophota bacterium]